MASRKSRKKTPEKKQEKKVIEAIQKGGVGRLSHDLAAKYSRLGVSLLSDEEPKKLDPTLRREMETFLSFDPSEVRIHTGEKAQISAEAMGARAFAVGERDIFFAKGEFKPASTQGKALIAHELAHLADSGFGLKRLHRSPTEEEFEIKAKAAEGRIFAEEESLAEEEDARRMLEPKALDMLELEGGEPGAKGAVKKFDLKEVEELVWDILDKQIRREKERSGM